MVHTAAGKHEKSKHHDGEETADTQIIMTVYCTLQKIKKNRLRQKQSSSASSFTDRTGLTPFTVRARQPCFERAKKKKV